MGENRQNRKDGSGGADAERALRESEERFRALAEGTFEAIVIHEKGIILEVNRAFCKLFGVERQEVLGKSILEFAAPESREMVKRNASSGHDQPYQATGLKKDGTRVQGLLIGRKIRYRDRNARITAMRDLTDYFKVRQALQESEAKYSLVVEQASEIVAIFQDDRCKFVNRAVEKYGYKVEDMLGRHFMEFVGPGFKDQVTRFHADRMGGRPAPNFYEIRLVTGDGKELDVEVSVAPIVYQGRSALLGIFRDISARKRAEQEHRKQLEKMQQSQKLESLGLLAGGIAHDFNNLLMGVLGNASLAMLELPTGSPALETIKKIERAAEAAADLTRQMLAYSGKGRFVDGNVDLSQLVEEMIGLLKASVAKQVKLNLKLAEDLPSVWADAVQFRQVVMNLITNACEAVAPDGDVTVRTLVIEVDQAGLAKAFTQDARKPGSYVCLEVSDTGSGVDRQDLGKIFDPFFTTKFTGRGLGLAVVLGIVRGHQGIVWVESEPGGGSTFRVAFPPSRRMEERATDQPGQRPEDWRGGGAILLVDDEADVRDVCRRMLQNLGFEVLEADGGAKALEIFRAERDRIVLVLLDTTMPGVSGQETFEGLKRLQPDVQVMLSSGYSQMEATAPFAERGLAGFIQKPYRLSALTAKLRKVLE